MPYPNEHACRVREPGEFTRFRRDNSKNPNVIMGFRSDGSSDVQAYRYPVSKWTADKARAHCKEHGGRFELASEEKGDEPTVERRFVSGGEIELRASITEDTKLPHLVGYAALFNVRTHLDGYMGPFVEVLEQGAFTRVLENNPDVRALFNHDPSQILGRTKAGTLKLLQNSKGLKVDIRPNPKTTVGRDVVANIERGDIDQMSYAFKVTKKGEVWDTDDATGLPLRRLRDIALLADVSPVTYPATPETVIAARSLELSRTELGLMLPADYDDETRALMAEVKEHKRAIDGYECGG